MTGQRIQQEAICYQWFKQRLILSVSKPSISQRSQIKEDTVETSVPARDSAYRDATNSATESYRRKRVKKKINIGKI